MNIFFLNSIGEATWGGGEKWMLTVADGLRQRGHHIVFGGRENSLFLERCREQGFDTVPLKIKGDFGPVNISKLAGIFRRQHIDIIIANFNKDARLAGLAKRIANVPILIVRNGLPILQNNWRYRFTFTKLADGILTNTYAIKKRYLTYGWLEDDFITVIHNGIDVHQPVSFERENVIRKYNLPNKQPVVGIFGRLVKQKQHNIFLEVARNLLKEWPEAIFIIVGEGPLREEIQQYAYDLGILDNVYLLGLQKQVMELYSICDVVLLTSEEEGLPNAIMEAMLAGKPVVAFDVGGVNELIISEKTGIIVPPNDIYLMTQRTTELLLSPEVRETIGKEARKFVMENFSVEKMITETERYLKTLLERKIGGTDGTKN